MALKKPSERASSSPVRRAPATEAEVEALAQRLADRPYGQENEAAGVAQVEPAHQDEQMGRTTISWPLSLQRRVEDVALANKRSGNGPKSTSALMREAMEQYLDKSNK
ncbi:hypothetical protein KGP26_30130 (plasmid) [Serratia sp. JSRIV002]|uniref:hypothetical protein n=1 Tax=Serratia sp. JSRIV002 TaxID=2831894 RepID=UPI001CBDF3D1|nr:hypothetical protein [Serratia sp. JSRIV002]UAN54715.1 hypothetical protein KGP26_30130 [Serratia sp. JSRIV002]